MAECRTCDRFVGPDGCLLVVGAVDPRGVCKHFAGDLAKATAAEVASAAAAAHPEPSQPQIEAGNYRKGKIRLHGLAISIENAKGSIRRGTGPTGPWEAELPAHYGYIRGTVGADGDHVDVFIGPNPESLTAWVVDQINAETGQFDEHKILLGYDSLLEALADYWAAFSDGKDRVGAISRVSVAGLKEWLRLGVLAEPVGNHVGKAIGKAAGAAIERQRARGRAEWAGRY